MEETVRLVTKLDLDMKKRFLGHDLIFLSPSPNCTSQQIKDSFSYLHYQGLSWHAFSLINSKSANLTFRDVFTRQLMTIKGVSREKAVALVAKYGSLPKMIVRLGESDGLRELAEMTIGQRKLGNVLAQRINDIFFLSSYPLE
jgi:hypothetical protein